MASHFKHLCWSFIRNWKRCFPALLLAQCLEVFLILLNQLSDVFLVRSPILAFALLYPVFCLASSVGSVLTLKTLESESPFSPFQKNQIKNLLSYLFPLFLTSIVLGLVMIPATLALVVPAIFLLSHYLFLPFLVMKFPNHRIDWYFGESKKLSQHHRSLCLFTAVLGFVVSGVSLLGVSVVEKWVPLSPYGGLFIEMFLGVLLSAFLNTWTVTLFLEITQHERPS